MNLLAVVLLVFVPLDAQVFTTRVTGSVTTGDGPLPGAKVTFDGITREVAIANEKGLFELRRLPLGAYEVVAEIPGFRTETRKITVTADGSFHLDFNLPIGVLQEPNFVVPNVAEAYQTAVAVAHVRIERTAAPGECRDVVTAEHLVRVLAVAKGELAPSIWFSQMDAGACFVNRQLHSSRPPYVPGDEFIVFLRKDGELFESLLGRQTIRVKDGRVTAPGFLPVRAGATVEETWAALLR